ncbi:MAG: phage minor tail protein L [Halobacteriota archaeon]|nr:phage minor tail protein L [Halobacteriota archaeon]
MTLDSEIASDVQEFDLGEFVELYEIDLTSIGGSITRITSHTDLASPITFNGNAYIPINCKAEGFEFTSKNQLPRPTFTVSIVGDTGFALRTLIRDYDDLIGIPFTRRRTFSQYLGGTGQPELPQDTYAIERKVLQNNMVVQWELSAFMDHEGKKIPARLILKDNCTHVYRLYSEGSFDYSIATCPYTGTDYFDRNGNVTTAENDKCGKKLSDCKLRFPDSPLPTRAFPGVSRVRVR